MSDFVGGLLMLVLIVSVIWFFEKRRADALKKIAAQIGLDYAPNGTSALLDTMKARFELFRIGRSSQPCHLLSGRIEDVETMLFDHSYTTGRGKHQRTTTQAVAAFRIGQTALPRFALRPERFFDKVGALVGLDDIDFPGHKMFSRRYHLKGDDEATIRSAFDTELLDYIAACDGLCIEAHGEWIIVYRPGRKLKAKMVSALLQDSFEIATRLANARWTGGARQAA